MGVLRKNTLVVDFSVLPKRPDVEKVQEFLEKKVKLRLEDTTTIQLHNLRNCVYIETIDSETALRYERANCNKHTFVYNKKEFRIPIYVESEAVTVRVHDLPSHISHLTVGNFMTQYGVVISISRERWKNFFAGYFNGVRVLRMKLNRPIPSTVTIDGETSLVTYPKQPKTCRNCGQKSHPKQKCTQTPKTTTLPQSSTQELPEEESNASPDTVPSTQAEQQQCRLYKNRNNNGHHTAGDDGDNNDDDEDNEDETNGSDSADSSEFIETTNQKRRLKKKVLNKNESELKKMCLTQGYQTMGNRFQALIEIDSICPSDEQMKEYDNRSKLKNKNCNSSS